MMRDRYFYWQHLVCSRWNPCRHALCLYKLQRNGCAILCGFAGDFFFCVSTWDKGGQTWVANTLTTETSPKRKNWNTDSTSPSSIKIEGISFTKFRNCFAHIPFTLVYFSFLHFFLNVHFCWCHYLKPNVGFPSFFSECASKKRRSIFSPISCCKPVTLIVWSPLGSNGDPLHPFLPAM